MSYTRSKTWLTVLFLATLCSLPLWLDGCLPFPSVRRSIHASNLHLTQKWLFNSNSRVMMAPAISSGVVVIETESGYIGVSGSSGKELWHLQARKVDPNVNLLLFDDKLVYVSAFDTTVNVADARSGAILWSRPGEGPFDGQITRLAADRDRVYVGRGRERVRAYGFQDGTTSWELAEGLDGEVAAMSVRSDGLYVVNGASLYVLEPATGKLIRAVRRNFVLGDPDPRFFDDMVCGHRNEIAICRNLEGQIRYSFGTDLQYVTLIQDKIYGGLQKKLVAYSLSENRTAWQLLLDATPISSVVEAGGRGYVLLINGSIMEFDLDTGSQLGRADTEPAWVLPISSQGITTDGQALYLTFGDDTVFAFETK